MNEDKAVCDYCDKEFYIDDDCTWTIEDEDEEGNTQYNMYCLCPFCSESVHIN